jgi:hypothetical protein
MSSVDDGNDRTEADDEREWYAAYQRRGGTKSAEEFAAAAAIFLKTTFNAYVHGTGDRGRAFRRFMKLASCDRDEGMRIFEAIDEVTPYS